MRVLLTGAFGNIGANAAAEIARRGHDLCCFDLPTHRNRRVERQLKTLVSFETRWGDLRDSQAVASAVQGQDIVVHLAFIIPPHSDRDPAMAEAVNIGGTQNLLKALEPQTRFIFASSVAVYGDQQHRNPPRTVDDPVQVTDLYTEQKIRCEVMVKALDQPWAILRFTAVQPLSLSNVDPLMFEVPLQQRIEFLDTRDAGLAVANAIESDAIWGKILLIGGGPACQMTYAEYLGQVLDMMGLPRLPAQAFSTSGFHTDWLDTSESQALLQYQRHDYPAFLGAMSKVLGWRTTFTRRLPGLVRWWLLRQSPYHSGKSS